jgi:ABC-type uncharacterized transport system permease subunit
MKRKLDYIITAIIGLLGIVHVSLTPMFYDTMNEEATIFMGMGLAFIFLGALNLSRLLTNKKNATVICLVCNFFALIYLIYCAVISGKIEPQFLITIFAVLIVIAFSILQLKSLDNQ